MNIHILSKIDHKIVCNYFGYKYAHFLNKFNSRRVTRSVIGLNCRDKSILHDCFLNKLQLIRLINT